MPWKIRHIQPPVWSPGEETPGGGLTQRRLRAEDGLPPQVGDAWYEPEAVEHSYIHGTLSRQYEGQRRGGRLPIMVVLPASYPAGFWHCVDSMYRTSAENPGRDGWTVAGSLEAGDLTVSPSIDAKGIYHGFIRDGVITDDVEGRTYPATR